jgi:hypothetical protein
MLRVRERAQTMAAPLDRFLTGGDATVVGVALFLDTGRTNVRMEVERANGAFRVANIRYEHGDLVSLLRRLAEDRRRNR